MTPSTPPGPRPHRPAWLIALLLLLALPLLASPLLLANLPEDHGILMGFPLYAMLSLYLAYASWPSRTHVTWILIAILILSYISLIFLF